MRLDSSRKALLKNQSTLEFFEEFSLGVERRHRVMFAAQWGKLRIPSKRFATAPRGSNLSPSSAEAVPIPGLA